MASEPQKSLGWWQTLPGVLAALAAVLTALSGLAAVLFQNGYFGGQPEPVVKPTPDSQAHIADVRGNQDTLASAMAPSQPIKKPWSDVEAVVLSRDGATTRLRADSFSNCISVNHEISLENGQALPFERIASIEVLHADDHTTPNPKAGINIRLVNGKTISGKVKADCDLFGHNELGRFTIYWDRLQSVRFEH